MAISLKRQVVGRVKGPPAIAARLELKCDCGSDRVFAVAPGQEGEAWAGGKLTPGRRTQAWCEGCWRKSFGGD